MGGLNVTDVGREQIPLLWTTVGETALANGFCSNKGDALNISVSLQKNEAAWKRKGCTQ